jgi:hypothetical protein
MVPEGRASQTKSAQVVRGSDVSLAAVVGGVGNCLAGRAGSMADRFIGSGAW